MYRLIATTFTSLYFMLPLLAQFHVPVFPELDGEELIEAVADAYEPSTVLSYSDARDVLYGEIDAVNDTLYCVYTGFGIYLPPGVDPSDAAFQNGNGINAEHTYPRSKGTASTRPKADMHHIFPTRVDVNAARGSFPMLDVPDAQTQVWYIQDQQQSNIPPAATIDLYSELGDMAFEPRERHKGDVARAMFYVYTVYRTETDAADPLFFETQRTTLCLWNAADPVDAREFDRTYQIAEYQGGTQNPFILDCTLATRTYCGKVTPPCVPSHTAEAQLPDPLQLKVAPNPAKEEVTFAYHLPASGEVQLKLYSLQGQQLATIRRGYQMSGAHHYVLDLKEYAKPAGPLICRLQVESAVGVMEQAIRLFTKN